MTTAQDNLVDLELERPGFRLKLQLSLPAHGITSVLGPSGCGKTTLLRCIAGLERGAAGTVRIHGQTWQDSNAKLFMPTYKRPVGYVFQEASLFEHLNVKANLEYGLRRSVGLGQRRRLDEAIELLGIGALLHRSPSALSGGERQRVAIARALATEPRLLLLDEPLAALDEARKAEVLPWLDRLRREAGVPMLYVTHARAEALRLADVVVMMEAGQVVARHDDAQAALADRTATVLDVDAQRHAVCLGLDGQRVWIELPRHQALPSMGQAMALQLHRPIGAQ